MKVAGVLERELGRYPGSGEGPDGPLAAAPLLLIVGGMHGNEPAGVLAARRVLSALHERRPAARGSIVALAGNLAALQAEKRFLALDLNRIWSEGEVETARAGGPGEDCDERREQRELLTLLDALLARRSAQTVLLDLHSTSAPSPPFAIMADTLQNREVAFRLGVPVLLGLEERVDGTLLAYAAEHGIAAVCLEGGQNEDPATVDRHEDAIWITLAGLGIVAPAQVPDLAVRRAALRTRTHGLPRVIEVRHHEEVPRDADFAMLPGYENFARVRRGEVLAHAESGGRRRPIRCPLDGLLLMPRYQGQGDDAFFIGRQVQPVWLRLSAALRRLHADQLLTLLPGIEPDAARAGRVLVDPRIARWFTTEILHLFGYRKSRREGARLVFVRRRDAPGLR